MTLLHKFTESFLRCSWCQNTKFLSIKIRLESEKKVKVKVTQLCPTLCYPMDYTVHGILQARILEWVAFSFSRGSSQPRDGTKVSCMAGRHFTSWATREGLLVPEYLLCHPSLVLQGSQECFVSAFWFSMKICGQGSAIHSKIGHQVRHSSGFLDMCVRAKSLQSCPGFILANSSHSVELMVHQIIIIQYGDLFKKKT